MRKIVLLFFVFLFSFAGAQDAEKLTTIIELETEQRLAERIEKMIDAYFGKSIVIVDLELSYPSYLSTRSQDDTKFYYKQDEIDKSRSEILKNRMEGINTDQITVINTSVNILLPEKTEDAVVQFVEESVTNLLKLNLNDGDELSISRNLVKYQQRNEEQPNKQLAKQDEQAETSPDVADKSIDLWLIIALAIIVMVILIILIVTLRSGFSLLNRSIENAPESSGDVKLGIKPETTSARKKDDTSLLRESSKTPLRVNISREQEEQRRDLPQFSFLEDLEPKEFFELIAQERIGKEALSYILSTLSVEYVNNLMNQGKEEDVKKLLESITLATDIPKNELIELQKCITEGYEQKLEQQLIKTDGAELLINFINHLTADKSSSTYERIKEVNLTTADQIRNEIFLYDDIKILEDEQLRDINRHLDHDLLVAYLSICEDDIKQKLIDNMTDRTAAMIREELSYATELSDAESSEIKDTFFLNVKSILGYI